MTNLYHKYVDLFNVIIHIYLNLVTILVIPASSLPFPSGSSLFFYHGHPDLARTRAVARSLLPARLLTADNDDYILPLIEHFRQCFHDGAQNISRGVSHEMFQAALADAVGGYLHHHAIPITTQAYYAGKVRYDYARMLFAFQDDILTQLGTSGGLWGKPLSTSGGLWGKPLGTSGGLWGKPLGPSGLRVRVKKLATDSVSSDEDHCSVLITNDRVQGTRFPPGRNGVIPLPYLDSSRSPNAIAIPFVSSSVRNLASPFEERLLERFYTSSMRCLRFRSCCDDTVKRFNRDFYEWLESEVVPHLNDDHLYPAFGGVLKLVATMQPYLRNERWYECFLKPFYVFWRAGCSAQRDESKTTSTDVNNAILPIDCSETMTTSSQDEKWHSRFLRLLRLKSNCDWQVEDPNNLETSTKYVVGTNNQTAPWCGRMSYLWEKLQFNARLREELNSESTVEVAKGSDTQRNWRTILFALVAVFSIAVSLAKLRWCRLQKLWNSSKAIQKFLLRIKRSEEPGLGSRNGNIKKVHLRPTSIPLPEWPEEALTNCSETKSSEMAVSMTTTRGGGSVATPTGDDIGPRYGGGGVATMTTSDIWPNDVEKLMKEMSDQIDIAVA